MRRKQLPGIRRAVILMLLCCCTIVAAAQSVLDKRVSVDKRNATVTEILNEVNRQSGISFVYNSDDLKALPCITIARGNTAIKTILDDIVSKTGCNYSVSGNVVTLTLSPTPRVSARRLVSGTVTDDGGEPLVGVTVKVKGETSGVVTNNLGVYNMTLPSGNSYDLVYSYIGMDEQTAHIPAGTKNLRRNLTMKGSSTNISEVVVNGVYTRKAESYTGAATTISGRDLKRVSNQNLLQSLKSLDASVYIPDNLTMGSDPNSTPSVSMRGTSSFPAETSSLKSTYQNQPNEPQFILDGFETTAERVKDLDMNRVESVTILKDASAKALYGSKAANGVIVIETRRLAGTEARVTYNGSLDLELPDLSSYDMTNALEKLQVEQYEGLYYNANITTQQKYTTMLTTRKRLALEGLNTDWLSKPLHTGVGQKHNINIELGDARNLRGVINFTYNDVTGAMKGSYRRNFSGDVSLSYRRKNFLFKNILSVVSNHSADSPYGTFSDYVKMNPYWRATDDNGNVVRWAENIDGYTYSVTDPEGRTSPSSQVPNPLYDAEIGTSLKSTYSEFVNNFYVEWQVIPDLKATLRFGVDHKRNDVDDFYPPEHSRFANYSRTSTDWNRRGLYVMENGKSTQLSGDLNLNYNHAFGKHHVFGNGGYFVSEDKYQAYQVRAEGFSNQTVADITFANQYVQNSRPSGYASVNREMSFLLAGSYDYDNRYLLDATVRESASSLYGSDKRWANSWSVGIGWNLNNEPFMKDATWLKEFKVRGSIGLTGNQNFNTNEAMATYSYYTGNTYGGLTGAYLSVMPNPDLQWEQKKDYNVGFDMRAFGISLTFDLYKADTKNMLTNVSIPTSTGFSSVKDNLGLVRNSGVELKATYIPWQSKNGFLSIYGQFTYTKNRIIHLSESMREYNERMLAQAAETNQTAPVLMYQDGLSMNTIWAVPSAGIDPQTGQEIYIKKDGSLTYDYDSDDMVAAGDATPKYRGNFGFTVEYKGIGLTATATYLTGCKMYNYTLVDRVEDADIHYNVDRRVLEGRWQQPGDVTQYKGYSSTERTRATTRFVQNRRELSLTSLSAYYEFPRSIYSKLCMQRLRFSVYLNDVFTLSSIKVERGTSYPFARTLSFALSATF